MAKKNCQCGWSGETSSFKCPRCGSSLSECFPASTQILTVSGMKSIAEIEAGEMVVAYGTDGALSSQKVLKRKNHGPTQILRVVTDDGKYLRVTGGHSVLTSAGWRRINQLQPDDILLSMVDGVLTKNVVLTIEVEANCEPVYNLIVDGDYTFLPEGCIAHSFTYFRTPRIWFSRFWHSLSRPARQLKPVLQN